MKNIFISFLILFWLMGNLDADQCKKYKIPADLFRIDIKLNSGYSNNTVDGFSVSRESPYRSPLKDDKTNIEYGVGIGVFDKCVRLGVLGRKDELVLNANVGYGKHLFFDKEDEKYEKKHKSDINIKLEYSIPINY